MYFACCMFEHFHLFLKMFYLPPTELEERPSSVSPGSVFFGVSLVLCLMGIGAGAVFFTKQPN